ncbi:type I secretion system permease/ATPase [Vibrio agarivorans]|uniref:ATP-binding cassette domain-containing protein n=1 Tax=Vibrio agarivorans TaxID=153622 RepID=A0ABT7Y0K8_9VIBR|nr:ATP-binding cassette domain-containing protein [Vibrio agarivorans]MDN2481574.1 ATP-binding cassette domain-containing protein [Vibrio agarivorans]
MVINKWRALSPFTFKALGAVIVVSSIVNLLMLVVPVYSLQLFDRVLSSRSVDTLLLLTLIAVFLLICQSLLDNLRQKYAQKQAVRFDAQCSQALHRHTVQASKHEHRYIFNDVSEVRALLASPNFFVTFDLPWTPIFILVMFFLHPIIGAVGLTAVCTVLLISLVSYLVKRKAFDDAHVAQIAFNRKTDELFSKKDTIQSQQLGDGHFERFQIILAEKMWFKDRIDLSTVNLTSLAKFVRMSLQLAIMGVGAYLVINNAMSAGGMIAGSILMARALQPIEQMTASLQGWKTALSAAKRIKTLINSRISEKDRTELPNVRGALRLDHVIWAPNNNTQNAIIGDLSFKLEAGNRVAIVGASGSGKSSLCKMLVGLINPTSGSVYIDELKVPHWDIEQFKSSVGYVPQHIQFLHGSVKDNIAHFDSKVSDSQITRAAIKAGVHETITQLPNSYETIIGEHGHQLSGGQAQKVALARALCLSPKLLVMDEPSSHMDKEGEAFLTDLLESCRDSHTSVVMVTHQPHLLRHVDWVVELANGQIIKAGRASEVLRSMVDVAQPRKQAEASNE